MKQIIKNKSIFGIICDSSGNKLAKVERKPMVVYSGAGECSGAEVRYEVQNINNEGQDAEEKCAIVCNTGEYGGFIINRAMPSWDDRFNTQETCFCEVPSIENCSPNPDYPNMADRKNIPWSVGSNSMTLVPVDRWNFDTSKNNLYCWESGAWVQKDESDYFTCDGHVISVDPFAAIPGDTPQCEITVSNGWSLGRGYLAEDNCYSPSTVIKDYELCGNTNVEYTINEESIVEINKTDYIAKQMTNGQSWSSQTAFVTPYGETRYFMCSKDNARFSTSCTPKTFGIVTAKNSSDICETQCAKWKNSLERGFQDGSIDVELTGTVCDEMTNNVKPVISNACQTDRRRLGTKQLGEKKIKFLGAGKNHAIGHFHYKVSVPGTWDSSSSIEYFECETDACTSKYSIKKVYLQTPNTVLGGIKIQNNNNVYDIECDAVCLGAKFYKYTKVEFKTSSSSNGEIVVSCPGNLVSIDGTCTDNCLRHNRGVCFRLNVLALHDTGPKSYTCTVYNNDLPKCEEGRNKNTSPCRCFSSTSIHVTIVAPREICTSGQRSVAYHDAFIKDMQTMEDEWQNDYVFFYPEAPSNQWYNDSVVSLDYVENYVDYSYSAKPRTGKCNGREYQMPLMVGTDTYSIRECAEACTAYSGFKSGGFVINSIKTACWCEEASAGCTVDGNLERKRWDFTGNVSTFDIVLGASQGAAMAMASISSGNTFDKAVLFDAYIPNNLNIITSFSDVDAFLYFNVEEKSNVKDKFPYSQLYESSTGYMVPQNETIKTNLKTFLDASDTCLTLKRRYDGECMQCTTQNTVQCNQIKIDYNTQECSCNV
jgi:hypothetical protein